MNRRDFLKYGAASAAALAVATTVPLPGSVGAATSVNDAWPLIGVTADSTDLSAKMGLYSPEIVRLYNSSLPPSSFWTTGLGSVGSQVPVIASFKAPNYDLAGLTAGAYDSQITQFFQSAPTGFTTRHPLYWTFYHEPEAKVANGYFSIAQWQAAWQHVNSIAEQVNNPFMHSSVILMGYDFQAYPQRPWQPYLQMPGIHSVFWDCYSPDGTGTPAPADFLAQPLEASLGLGFPTGVAEFGTTTISGRGPWMTSVASYVKSLGCQQCVCYCSSYNGGIGGSGTFELTDSASQQAWVTACAS